MDSHSVRRAWAERSGEYSPDYYAYYGPNETSEALKRVLDGTVGSDAAVLELGCSAGRHLAHLHEHGYTRLSGIEINSDAVSVMAQSYPDLVETSSIYTASFQEILPKFGDDELDAVFSVQTLQHVHPDDDWVFAELARIAGVVVTVENEHPDPATAGEVSEDGPGDEVTYVRDDIPLYHRDWEAVFTDLGLTQVAAHDIDRETLRVFTA